MPEVVSEDTFLCLPEGIQEVSEEKGFATRLSKRVIDQYYYSDMRKDLKELFVYYLDAKWLLKAKDYDCVHSLTYSSEYITISRTNDDKVSKYVTRNVDLEKYVELFYHATMSVAKELTLSEAVYLVDSLFCDRPEELISDKLCISVKTLTKIKKSCLVKVYLEFKNYGLIKKV